MNLDLYAIDLNECLGQTFSEYEFDENGNPLTQFFRQPTWKHNPVTVCQYGLYLFNRYLKNQSSEDKEKFLAQADWLVRHSQAGVDDSAVWVYQFDLPYYRLVSPWISGMAQGQALSVLLRAHQLTKKDQFLNLAQRAWKCFSFSAAQGGVCSRFPDGKIVIEEYPSAFQTTAVLNGFIFAIFGVYDYARYTEAAAARRFFDELVASLKQNLFRYDSGYWSYYDLAEPLRLTSKVYHQLHICQLKKMYQLTNEEKFRIYFERWEKYSRSLKANFRWLLKKVHQKTILGI